MKILNLLLLFFIVNCHFDQEYSNDYFIQHNYRILNNNTGFSIEYVGNLVIKNYKIFTNFENEIENRFVLDRINNNYTIVNYANNIEVPDSIDDRLECLYYSKLVNNLNYTILNYENVTFYSTLVHINYDYIYCFEKDIHDNNSVLLYMIFIVYLCVLVLVLTFISISCGVMRHHAIARVHSFTRNPSNAIEGIKFQN